MQILETFLAIVVLAAPCTYTSMGLKTKDKMKWHVVAIFMTTALFLLLAVSHGGQMHYQQMFIIGLPTLLVMLFSSSLVRSEERN